MFDWSTIQTWEPMVPPGLPLERRLHFVVHFDAEGGEFTDPEKNAVEEVKQLLNRAFDTYIEEYRNGLIRAQYFPGQKHTVTERVFKVQFSNDYSADHVLETAHPMLARIAQENDNITAVGVTSHENMNLPYTSVVGGAAGLEGARVADMEYVFGYEPNTDRQLWERVRDREERLLDVEFRARKLQTDVGFTLGKADDAPGKRYSLHGPNAALGTVVDPNGEQIVLQGEQFDPAVMNGALKVMKGMNVVSARIAVYTADVPASV